MRVNPETTPGGCGYIAAGSSDILNQPIVLAEMRPVPVTKAAEDFLSESSCQKNLGASPADIWCPGGDIAEIDVFEPAGDSTRWLQYAWPKSAAADGDQPSYEQMRSTAVQLLAEMS